MLDEPVKLVIWDLDETFWDGTLTEGGATVKQEHAAIVRSLNRRGIINSICSKNDPDPVRTLLEGEHLWGEFVFASITWQPKGQQVTDIISNAQLRAPNVLFIDDSDLNRREASHFAPGLQTAGPEIIPALLDLPQLAGADDPELVRLQRYKLMEQKLADRSSTPGSNEEFLRSCDIRVEISTDCEPEFDRLLELLQRTNQLNFTKRRLSGDELRQLLAEEHRETGYLRVSDRYGDYGVCGLYSVLDGELTDLLFSCRILHMGVEQWLYQRLGEPRLVVQGEVASSLERETPVDWISEGSADPAAHEAVVPGSGLGLADHGAHLVVRGGCDLSAIVDFLGGHFVAEVTRIDDRGARIRAEHTVVLQQSQQGLSPLAGKLVDRLPFLDREAFETAVFGPEPYDILIYSLLSDYSQGLYRHVSGELTVAFEKFGIDVTDPRQADRVLHSGGQSGLDRELLEWFAGEFEPMGCCTPSALQDNVRWLASAVPNGTQVVLLNGAEVPVDRADEVDRHLFHRRMNDALDDVVGELPNVSLCDIRKIVVSRDQLTDNIRHYQRQVYLEIAREIAAVSGLDVRSAPRPRPGQANLNSGAVLARRLKGALRRQSPQLVRKVTKLTSLTKADR